MGRAVGHQRSAELARFSHQPTVSSGGFFVDPRGIAIVGTVPEPSTGLLLACGLLGLMLVPLTNDGSSFSGQLIGAATIFIWVFATSLVVWSILKAVMGIRVTEEEEYEGVDLAECGQEAYPEFTQS